MPLGFVVALTALYSTIAVRLHLRVHTGGYDLGIFEQAIRDYAALRPPIVELKGPGFNLLGDHFHPILVLIAPFYAVFPTPITLLVAQAFLFALAAWPLVSWAQRALGTRVAVAVGCVYGLSFGIASAVGFDFHEIAFAVPLLAFSLSALGQGRLTAASAWALPLLLVKEDLGVTAVAGIGVLIAWRGARRLGIVTAVIGIAASAIEMTVLLPLVNSAGSYDYWSKFAGGRPILEVALTSVDEKLGTLLLTLAITGFAAVCSPIVLVALPTLLWRFVGDDPNYWGTRYHYSAVLMPIVVAAMIEALARWKRSDSRRARRGIRVTVVAAVAITLVTIPNYSLERLIEPTLWQPNPRAGAIHAALAKIPDGATVSASDDLVPQLTSRATVTLFGLAPLNAIRPEWIVVDPYSSRHFQVHRGQEQRDLAEAQTHGYRVTFHRDGITLLRRSP
ncbi:DUF2079 domain-containing protein [Lacisediminihabitans profunda]|uniref:DUF2079 domain-containing protein n=1 Tax=Lacisediminihabitans profunda TaxID=2594790 RepID=A0A5C8UUE3_9MICO|nr:DUF2079 domain-containing protein [Lacisediminihabitans profunda]